MVFHEANLVGIGSLREDEDWPLSKNIISRYCNNFAITSSRSVQKVCINIPGIKVVKNGAVVWIENWNFIVECLRLPQHLKFGQWKNSNEMY